MIPIVFGKQREEQQTLQNPSEKSKSYQHQHQYEYEYQYEVKYKENMSYKDSDGEDSGTLLGSFASKAGSAGAKLGKKAAKSEAGRRATKAAMRGAFEGVKEDMLGGQSEPHTPTSPGPSEIERPSSSQKKEKPNEIPTWMDSDDDERPAHRYSEPKPPKPSLKDKFMKTIGYSSSSRTPPRRITKNPKDRIYNSRLAKAPNWDELPRVQALFNYKAEMKCDLEFRKGQVIKVITRTDSQDDWWEGKIENRVGIFPANYVKLLF